MDNFVIFGVAGALAVKRIVDALKAAGLPSRFAQLAVFVTALVLLSANEAAALYPVFAVWYERGWWILFLALGSMEVYEVKRSLNGG